MFTGILLILAMACGSDSDSSSTTASAPESEKDSITPTYEPRSFDDVKPQVVDLNRVSAPALSEIPDCNGEPRNVRVTLETLEIEKEIAPGITFPFMTFNGSVPSLAIVVCLGDWVELTLKNLVGNKFAHNIDLHAATGAMGGGAASIVGPGTQTTFRFQALKEGAFVYHCAVAPIAMHVTSGMYGSIVVPPKGGLSRSTKSST